MESLNPSINLNGIKISGSKIGEAIDNSISIGVIV